MLLVILEPLVTFAFGALALFGLLTTLFFYLVGPPDFPLWTMLALSLGFAIVLVPYHALIRLLSNASECRMSIVWGQPPSVIVLESLPQTVRVLSRAGQR